MPSTALGINGFGRIGRLVMRAALDNPDSTVVAVNDPFLTLEYAAYQLKHDSVHGIFDKEIKVQDGCMIVDGVKVHFFSERNPEGTSGPTSIKAVFVVVVVTTPCWTRVVVSVVENSPD